MNHTKSIALSILVTGFAALTLIGLGACAHKETTPSTTTASATTGTSSASSSTPTLPSLSGADLADLFNIIVEAGTSAGVAELTGAKGQAVADAAFSSAADSPGATNIESQLVAADPSAAPLASAVQTAINSEIANRRLTTTDKVNLVNRWEPRCSRRPTRTPRHPWPRWSIRPGARQNFSREDAKARRF